MNIRKIAASVLLPAAAISGILVMGAEASGAVTPPHGTCITRHYSTKVHPRHFVNPYLRHLKSGAVITVKGHWVAAHTTLAHIVTTCY